MRVAQLMEWNFEEPGGIQSHVRTLASQLINHGHYIIVIMKKRLVKVNKYGFSTYYLKPQISYPATAIPVRRSEILRILHKENINIAHIHHMFSPFSVSATLAAYKAEIPVVFTNHTVFWADKKYLLNMLFFHKVILNRASKIISVSKAADRIAEIKKREPSFPMA